jgi:hypothetical protein
MLAGGIGLLPDRHSCKLLQHHIGQLTKAWYLINIRSARKSFGALTKPIGPSDLEAENGCTRGSRDIGRLKLITEWMASPFSNHDDLKNGSG